MSDPAGAATNPAAGKRLLVRNLSIRFGDAREGFVEAVRDVSVEVAPGEVVALVGESGSGKTTLALAIFGLVGRSGSITQGEVLWGHEDLLTVPTQRRRELMGSELAMVFQNPAQALHPAFTVRHQMREVWRAHHDDMSGCSDDLLRGALARVGLPDPAFHLGSYPHELSGGMSQRVMIAMALLNGPGLLVADEPTSALDMTMQAQILALIKGLVAESRLAVLFITHSLPVVAAIADKVGVMRTGELVESGHTQEVLMHPQDDYTQQLIAAARKLSADSSAAVPPDAAKLADVPTAPRGA